MHPRLRPVLNEKCSYYKDAKTPGIGFKHLAESNVEPEETFCSTVNLPYFLCMQNASRATP